MTSRRAILGGLLSGTALGIAGLFRPLRGLTTALEPKAADPAQLFAPIRAGKTIALGWSLESISPPITGAVFLNFMHHSGAKTAVRVCRRAAQPLGMTHSDLLDFVIMRTDHAPTDESFGRVLLGVADAARRNERKNVTAVNLLSTHEQHLAACLV